MFRKDERREGDSGLYAICFAAVCKGGFRVEFGGRIEENGCVLCGIEKRENPRLEGVTIILS